MQKAGGVAAFIDAEHALDPAYARKLGVKTDELLVSQPDYGEQALEIADMLVRSGAVDLIVVDSVAALVPKAEIEGDMGDSHVGLQARLMSQALRKLTSTVARSNCLLVFINQIRMKIGVMFGSPETTTGGNALKFYASVRLDIRRIGAIKEAAADGRKRPGRRRQPHARQGREEQAGPAVPRGRVRHPLRPGHLPLAATWSTSRPSWASSRRAAPGSRSAASASARAARTRKTYLEQHPEVMDKIEAMILAKHGIKRGAVRARRSPAVNGARHATAEEKRQAARAPSKPAN